MSRRDDLLRVWTEHANIGYIPNMYTDYNFLKPKYVLERPEGHDGYDWFGVHWTYEELSRAPMPTRDIPYIITDLENWREQVKFPDLTQYDWETLAAEETANWDRENKISQIMIINGCFERSHHLLGFENALMAMYEEPEAYAELLDAIADYKVQLIEIIGKYYRPDIIMMHDDYGAAQSMLMSPEKWREFIKKPLSRLVKAAHDNGMVYEHHSCGYVEPIIGDLIEIGVDAINPLQPCNDLKAIKEKYTGKITMLGGFNVQAVLERPGVTPEEIMADVQKTYDIMASGGGYVGMAVSIGFDFVPAFLKKHMEICRNYGK